MGIVTKRPGTEQEFVYKGSDEPFTIFTYVPMTSEENAVYDGAIQQTFTLNQGRSARGSTINSDVKKQLNLKLKIFAEHVTKVQNVEFEAVGANGEYTTHVFAGDNVLTDKELINQFGKYLPYTIFCLVLERIIEGSALPLVSESD